MKMITPFQSSKTTVGLPGIYYTDIDFFDRKLSRIWHHTWQFLARDEDITEPGYYVTCTFGKEPIFVVRLANGSLKAMHNVCRHRGAKLLEERGNCKGKITCPYHA